MCDPERGVSAGQGRADDLGRRGPLFSRLSSREQTCATSRAPRRRPGSCVHIVGSGVTISGSLEIHASDLWVDGGQSRGGPYGSPVRATPIPRRTARRVYPDHVVVSGVRYEHASVCSTRTRSPSKTWTRARDVSRTAARSFRGRGSRTRSDRPGGNTSSVPTNVTLDGLVIHDQNGDAGEDRLRLSLRRTCSSPPRMVSRSRTRCSRGTSYTTSRSRTSSSRPAPTNVIFDRDSFGCPVDLALPRRRAATDQSSIQFDGTFPSITIKNSAFQEAETPAGDATSGTSDYSQDTFSGNTFAAASTKSPPLP